MRAWLDANAKKRTGKREISAEDMGERRRRRDGRVQGVAEDQGESRLCPHHLAQGHGRHRRHADAVDHLRPGGIQIRCRERRALRHRPRHVHPDPDGLWRRGGQERFVWPAVQGDEIWCQLFSEPAGGSDVANLRTKAEKDGDTWTINGSKIWTTGAQFSDYGIILTRTDPGVPKHKGLTMFYIDMKDPGVDIRPIKQASGGAGFNEIFFTDVKVKDGQRLGEVGQGWTVALTTLMHERLAVGGGAGGGLDVPQLMALARELELEDGPAIRNAAVREKIADWYVRSAGLRYTTFRTMTALSQGKQPGTGGLDRQDRRRRQAAGPFGFRDGARRRGRRPARRRGADARPVPGRLAVGAGPAHRRRHRRDFAQHHRRARPGPSRRHPRRQGRPLQQDPDGAVGANGE
ncbi:MAG: acyl-CoA dehydrogenase family protein [Rhizomicrobium sp.]